MGAKFRAKKDVWQSDISALITTYITHQKFELATRYIIKGLKRDRDNEAFYRYNQGYIYMCMQEYNKARAAFQMYRDIMPLSDKYNLTGSCLALSGICHVMRDEYDKAVDFFIMAIPYLKCGQFPNYPEPQIKKYQEARSLFFRLYRTAHFNNTVCLRELS